MKAFGLTIRVRSCASCFMLYSKQGAPNSVYSILCKDVFVNGKLFGGSTSTVKPN